MNGAEAIVKCLEAEQVETVFGYPGGAICPVYDCLIDSPIRTILVRTEQNAAHCASGYARISGKPGVCICTSGPGATNLISGIATAYADSIPLIVITGQVTSDLLGSDVFQEADITGAVESFVKYSYLVRNAADIPRMFREAFFVANTGRKGPVLIDIPTDVQLSSLRRFQYPEEVNLRTYKPTVKGNQNQIKKLMNALPGAKRPLLCVGGGVLLSGASKEVISFAEKYSIPMACTMMGVSAVPTDHPLFLGMMGNNGNAVANFALQNCDLLMIVGARIADRAISNPAALMRHKTLVHIDVDPAEIGKNAPASIPIVGDAKAIFEAILLEEVEHPAIGDWIDRLAEVRAVQKPHPTTGKLVDPSRFVQMLSYTMPNPSVYVADVGQNQIWSCLNVCIHQGRFLTSGGMGCMGYAIPAAIGAKAAAPDTCVVAVCGDGSFQMSFLEFAAARQHSIPVKTVVFNNNTLGMVREIQQSAYRGRYTMVDLTGNPRLDKIAEAYDMNYLYLDSMDNAQAVIDSFLADETSTLLEVMIDPADNVK